MVVFTSCVYFGKMLLLYFWQFFQDEIKVQLKCYIRVRDLLIHLYHYLDLLNTYEYWEECYNVPGASLKCINNVVIMCLGLLWNVFFWWCLNTFTSLVNDLNVSTVRLTDLALYWKTVLTFERNVLKSLNWIWTAHLFGNEVIIGTASNRVILERLYLSFQLSVLRKGNVIYLKSYWTLSC